MTQARYFYSLRSRYAFAHLIFIEFREQGLAFCFVLITQRYQLRFIQLLLALQLALLALASLLAVA